MTRNRQQQQGDQGAVDPFDLLFSWPAVTQGARWDMEQAGRGGSFIPRIDIHEDKEAIRVDVELAGIPKEKINIEHHDDLLTISGENEIKRDEEDKDKKWHRVERRYGSFKRQIMLPQGIDHAAISASHKDGLLSVTIPKPKEQEKKTSKIAIN